MEIPEAVRRHQPAVCYITYQCAPGGSSRGIGFIWNHKFILTCSHVASDPLCEIQFPAQRVILPARPRHTFRIKIGDTENLPTGTTPDVALIVLTTEDTHDLSAILDSSITTSGKDNAPTLQPGMDIFVLPPAGQVQKATICNLYEQLIRPPLGKHLLSINEAFEYARKVAQDTVKPSHYDPSQSNYAPFDPLGELEDMPGPTEGNAVVYFQHSWCCEPGDSGTPLLTGDGKLAGIVFARNKAHTKFYAIARPIIDAFIAFLSPRLARCSSSDLWSDFLRRAPLNEECKMHISATFHDMFAPLEGEEVIETYIRSSQAPVSTAAGKPPPSAGPACTVPPPVPTPESPVCMCSVGGPGKMPCQKCGHLHEFGVQCGQPCHSL